MMLKKEKPGYLHNTLYINLLKTAILLVADGYAGVEDVDRSWTLCHPPAPGPFGMMDGVGLNVVLQIAEEEIRLSGSEEAKKMADFVRPFVERGHLGMKAGQGFYTYPDPAWMKPGFLTPPD
jgi:3-hydroxybutyryl-CoA dehydrogenase